jgi:hypothetical protein
LRSPVIQMRPAVAAGLAALAVGTAVILAGRAHADSTPIGPLPKGPVTTVTAPKGTLVSVALPHAGKGLVWRLARRVDPAVLRQVSEGDIGASVVVVFQARRVGNVRVAFAQTRGDTSSKALRSATTLVHVR